MVIFNLVIYEVLEQALSGSAVYCTGTILVVFHACDYATCLGPRHGKQQLEELASQLGLKADGTLDDLRRRVKEKWAAIEPFLPSPSGAAGSALDTKSESQVTGPLGRDSSYSSKMKIKVEDSTKNILLLADTDPENILKFLISVKGVYDLNLVTNVEFLSPGQQDLR